MEQLTSILHVRWKWVILPEKPNGINFFRWDANELLASSLLTDESGIMPHSFELMSDLQNWRTNRSGSPGQ
jgi:hypothetical protein